MSNRHIMKLKNETYVFWNSKDILSDIYISEFKYRGLAFKSVKQAYIWKLARLYDKKLCSMILKETNVAELNKIRRKMNISKSVELEHLLNYYKDIIISKLKTNEEFKSELLSTGNCNIVYASKIDFYLGSGLDYTLPSNHYINEIRGDNNLGILLTNIRNTYVEKNRKESVGVC